MKKIVSISLGLVFIVFISGFFFKINQATNLKISQKETLKKYQSMTIESDFRMTRGSIDTPLSGIVWSPLENLTVTGYLIDNRISQDGSIVLHVPLNQNGSNPSNDYIVQAYFIKNDQNKVDTLLAPQGNIPRPEPWQFIPLASVSNLIHFGTLIRLQIEIPEKNAGDIVKETNGSQNSILVLKPITHIIIGTN